MSRRNSWKAAVVALTVLVVATACNQQTPVGPQSWSYSGTNDEGLFVRPDSGGLGTAARTVGYHAFSFVPQVGGEFQIVSEQAYDGYVLLYRGSFDPDSPALNLVDSNDDYVARGWSRMLVDLDAGTTYVVVTTACGDPDLSPCGDAQGSFDNVIGQDTTPPEVEDPGEEPDPQDFTVLPPADNSRFNITLRFWSGGFDKDEMQVFYDAAERWSEIITADLQNVVTSLPANYAGTGAPALSGTFDDVVIDVAKQAIDGPSSTLARAGAIAVRLGGPDDILPVYGIMEFDEADFGPGQFFDQTSQLSDTVLHEMGHVLGISRSFWEDLGLMTGQPANPNCSDIEFDDDPRYVGANGAGAWHDVYGAPSETVPLEHMLGCGTADSHWREAELTTELMTGIAENAFTPISEVTIGAFEDIGYSVDYGAADAWSVPAVPALTMLSPVPVDYEFVWDFGRPSGASADLTAQVTAVALELGTGNSSSSGCQAGDFTGFPAGDMALVQRGGCDIAVKVQNAVAAGASAVLIGNQGDTSTRTRPWLLRVGAPVPVVAVSYEVMVELEAVGDAVMTLDSGADALVGPQRAPLVEWHLAEQLLPVIGRIATDGSILPAE